MLGRGLESLIPPQRPQSEQKEEAKINPPATPLQADGGEKNTFSPNAIPEASSRSVEKAEQFFSSNNPEIRKDFSDILSGENKETGIVPAKSLDFKAVEPAKEQIPVQANKVDFGEKYQDAPKKHHESIFLIEVEKIKPNPYQPRKFFDQDSIKELASSIQEFGILQPLLVTKVDEDIENGTRVSYQLIAGERRFQAAKMIGLERVPVIIKKVDLEANRLEMAIIENIQRSQLNPLESARAFSRLQDEFNLTQREIAQRVGKSREVVANTLRLLSLPTNIQDALIQNKINESQARLLLTVADLNQQQTIFNELISSDLSVRDLKEKIKDNDPESVPRDPVSNYLETQLEETLGAKVKISKTADKGKIVIKFFSPEELDTIVKKICSSEQ